MKHLNPPSVTDWLSSSLRGVVGAIALAAVLTGCAQLDQYLGIEDTSQTVEGEAIRPDLSVLASVAPSFVPGDRFAFNNPDVVWEVVAVEDGVITWRADNGDMQKTSANPLLPALEWASVGQGRGKRLITDMTEDFFPLRVGKEVAFRSTVSTDKPPYAWEFDWTCKVDGVAKMKVGLGEFDTYRILCGRQRPDELTFYYAPEIGHYVQLVAASRDGSGVEQRTLTAYMRVSPLPVVAMAEKRAQGGAGWETIPTGAMADQPAKVASEEMAEGRDPTEPVFVSELGMMASEPVVPRAGTQPPSSGLSSDGDAMMKNASAGGAAGAATAGGAAGAVAAGGLGVHIASYKNPDNTESGWKQALAQNPAVLEGTRPVVRRVDLGTKGIFYRLHAGPIASKTQAETMCRAIKSRGGYCAVVPL